MDVGVHKGFTLIQAMDPRYGFDTIWGFEPSRVWEERLSGFSDPRVRIVHAALGRGTGETLLHGAGGIGASVYEDKPTVGPSEKVQLVDVAEWVEAQLVPSDWNCLKLNCEGAEADILERLSEEGLIDWFSSILVAFDIKKVPSQSHRLAQLMSNLAAYPGLIVDRDEYYARGDYTITEWLDGAIDVVRPSHWARLRYSLGFGFPWITQRATIAKLLLPRPLFDWVVRRRRSANSG